MEHTLVYTRIMDLKQELERTDRIFFGKFTKMRITRITTKSLSYFCKHFKDTQNTRIFRITENWRGFTEFYYFPYSNIERSATIWGTSEQDSDISIQPIRERILFSPILRRPSQFAVAIVPSLWIGLLDVVWLVDMGGGLNLSVKLIV